MMTNETCYTKQDLPVVVIDSTVKYLVDIFDEYDRLLKQQTDVDSENQKTIECFRHLIIDFQQIVNKFGIADVVEDEWSLRMYYRSCNR